MRVKPRLAAFKLRTGMCCAVAVGNLSLNWAWDAHWQGAPGGTQYECTNAR